MKKKNKNANLITNNVGYRRLFSTLNAKGQKGMINYNKFNSKLELTDAQLDGGFSNISGIN